MECKHTDGWIVEDEFVISEEGEDDIEVMVRCNSLGCNKIMTFKIDVNNVRVVRDEN